MSHGVYVTVVHEGRLSPKARDLIVEMLEEMAQRLAEVGYLHFSGEIQKQRAVVQKPAEAER